jgi:hypothetical protein
MLIKRLQLGLAAARLCTVGPVDFIKIPTMIDPAMAGPTEAERKVLLYMDTDTGLLLGIKTAIPAEDPGAVRIDHGELLGRYGGVYVDGFRRLSQMFDLDATRYIDPSVSDVTTLMFVLGHQSMQKLGLLASEQAPGQDDTIAVLIQGTSTSVLMQLFGADDEAINRSDVAAFFAGEIFDAPPVPMRNGHDAEAAAAPAAA